MSLNRDRYQLCTANAIYSYEDLYDNFTEAFRKIPLNRHTIKNVLILGFGLGSVPMILEQKHQFNFHYTGIEIDEEVIYLASKYALPSLQSPIELICADAAAYVAQCQTTYDLVIMDVFLDDVVPDTFEQQSFLENLKKCITPNGILMYNRLAYNRQDLEQTRAFYEKQFKPVFTEGSYLEVHGNWILLNRADLLAS